MKLYPDGKLYCLGSTHYHIIDAKTGKLKFEFNWDKYEYKKHADLAMNHLSDYTVTEKHLFFVICLALQQPPWTKKPAKQYGVTNYL